MKRKVVLVPCAWLLLLLVAAFGVMLNVPVVSGSGTIYIRADGSIDPPTAPISSIDNFTYTFTDNITLPSDSQGIVIERNNITIDGAGYMLQGYGGNGFTLDGINSVTIRNTDIEGWFDNAIILQGSSANRIVRNNITYSTNGIALFSSINNSISENNLVDNFNGVYLDASCFISIVGNNIAPTEWGARGVLLESSSSNSIVGNNIANSSLMYTEGIILRYSANNSVVGNNITLSSDGIGIYIFDSPNNIFRSNSMICSDFNFLLDPSGYGSEYVQDMDESNTVDGKPVYYWVDRENMRVPPDAGFVALVNSYNITAEELKLSRNGQGILLFNTTDSRITRNKITENYCGIYLEYCFNNNVTGNEITNNSRGIELSSSSDNSIVGNEVTANNAIGVRVSFSYYNSIVGNNVANNAWGVETLSWDEPTNNEFHWNNFVDNTVQVVRSWGYSTSVWDDGYPSGGNYWSSYAGVDSFIGFYQNETGSDGICDTPYVIDADNQDHYPLMSPWILGAPRTCFSYSPEFPLAGETITFDASCSYSYQASIVSYTWDFGDGNTTTAADPIMIHVYTAEGVYPLNLTVSDNEGLSGSITKSIHVGTDSTPPTTLDDYDGLWHTTDFTITLTAADDLRGVAETYYRVNNGSIQNVTANGQPLMTTEAEDNKLEYWSTDNAGNEESHHILTGIKLDKTAPTGSILINNDATYTTSTSVTLTLTATDTTSGVYQVRYSNDDEWTTEPWESSSTTKAWTLTVGDGTKTVYYQIKDNAGHVSITYSDTITLDTTPPNGSVTIAEGVAYTNSTSVTLTLSANDATSGIAQMRFSNDNVTWSDWEAYATSKSWTLLTGDDLKNVTVQYRDNAGLISSANDSIILDTTKPTANAGRDQTVDEDTQVTLDGSASTDVNGISTYSWVFTDITPQTLAGPNPTYTFSTPGTYTITLGVTDFAGNSATASIIVTVSDITDPEANAGPDQTVPEDTLTVLDGSQSSDNVAVNDYTWTFIDETPKTLKGINPTYNFTTSGTYAVTLAVEDAAGNTAIDTVTVNVLLDTDGDKTPDVTDSDDDNDGLSDSVDAFPQDPSESLDTDGDGIGNNADNDDDNDGMPDTWETENRLDPLDAADATLDPDGDGITNLKEYQTGTNPNAPNAPPFPMLIVGAIIIIIGVVVGATLLMKRRK